MRTGRGGSETTHLPAIIFALRIIIASCVDGTSLTPCRAAPKPKPMASTPLEAEALALLEKQREGLSWSVSETDASGRPMPI